MEGTCREALGFRCNLGVYMVMDFIGYGNDMCFLDLRGSAHIASCRIEVSPRHNQRRKM